MKTGKILSIISLIVSVVAIGMCIFTLTATNKNQEKEIVLPQMSRGDSASVRLAYINTDTLMVRYNLVSDLLAEIDSQKETLDKDFAKRRDEFQKEVDYFQEQVNKGSLSEQSAKDIYEKLMQKQEELLILQEDYTTRMALLEQQQTQVLYDKVVAYLGKINENYKYYDFVFNHSILNSSILNANTCFDITDYVVNGLNEEYEKEQKTKK